jgi:penicillin amidase
MIQDQYSQWFDNVNTEKIETRDDIIRESLVDALSTLEKQFGKDLTYWQWGRIHKVTFKHLFSASSDAAGMLLDDGPYEIGGDGTTIFNTEYSFNAPYENKLGPSMRFIYDFANEEYFEYIIPSGQSGHFLSDHYKDMTAKWINGKYNKVYFNEDTIKGKAKNIMRFIKE